MPSATVEHVHATTLRDWIDDPDQYTVIDVRSPAEFETAHITGSHNLPLGLLAKHADQLAARLDREVVLVCQSGVRAEDAHRRLLAAGMQRLHVLTGGVPAYDTAGGVMTRGRQRWAMERQVRLAAGSLVLVGVTAGVRAPRAGLLAAAVGAGLTMSAITNSCAMARVLALLPYNRESRSPDAGSLLDVLPQRRAA